MMQIAIYRRKNASRTISISEEKQVILGFYAPTTTGARYVHGSMAAILWHKKSFDISVTDIGAKRSVEANRHSDDLCQEDSVSDHNQIEWQHLFTKWSEVTTA